MGVCLLSDDRVLEGRKSNSLQLLRAKEESSRGASMASSSYSSTPQWKYEVFLSFRGVDTRRGFTDHLHTALKRKGILTFRDDEELERGESISRELLKAIEESRFAFVIFSKNYASSTWCLDELANIVRCMTETGLTIWPIFYDVDPSDVRKQKGTFEIAFTEHEKKFKENEEGKEKVKMWRAALIEVANLSGWHLQDRHESDFIQHIVTELMKKLWSRSSSIYKDFVGMESTMAKFIPSYLGFENNVSMIGIYGMGGLGKTTLARVVFNEFRSHFEGSSFIADVREGSENHSMPRLQQQLLADILEDRNIEIRNVYEGVDMISKRLFHKKVLVVIDDANKLDQLQQLVGECRWFGLGSWIIITTRDEHLLIQHGVLTRYMPQGLNYDESSKLFCLKAFKTEQPNEDCLWLSQEVVTYAQGLPLALVTLGSFFIGRKKDVWQSALDSFKNSEGRIFDILKISYDRLEEMWKVIFLDIACFFRRRKKDEVIQILDNCGFHARIGISVLEERSLLTMDDNECLGMHDLLTEMGQKIIRFESGGNLRKQSRLWNTTDLLHVLENNTATEAIQAIVVNFAESGEENFNFDEFPEVFLKMPNLRLLIIDHKNISNAINRVPNGLRHLSCSGSSSKCLPSNFQSKELVHFELRFSDFEYLWEGVMPLVKLKFIDLSHSKNLIRTPDFSGVPGLEVLNLAGCASLVEIHPSIGQLSRLERLNLSWCDSLVEIHPSIGQLSRLTHLDLQYCESLTNLPSMSAEMQSLTILNLDGCSKIRSFPKFTGIMKSLLEVKLCFTAMKKLAPSSIACLTALTFLDLSECRNLKCLPSNMDDLRSLEKLILSGCSKLELVPRLPSTIRYVNAQYCYSLEWSPALVKLSRLSRPLFQWRAYDESGSGMAFTILYRHLQGLLFRNTIYETSNKRKEDGSITELLIIVYGYKIPSWLTHQSVGNSISMDLPSNWCNSKWMGFAFCASISVSKWKGIGVRACVIVNGRDLLGDMPQNHYSYELFTTWKHCEDSKSMHYVGRIWLLYLSRGNWFATVGNDECSQIKVIFETNDSAIHVCECGVSLVYEQDVDKFSQANAQCLTLSFDGDGDGDGDDEDEDDDDDEL